MHGRVLEVLVNPPARGLCKGYGGVHVRAFGSFARARVIRIKPGRVLLEVCKEVAAAFNDFGDVYRLRATLEYLDACAGGEELRGTALQAMVQ